MKHGSTSNNKGAKCARRPRATYRVIKLYRNGKVAEVDTRVYHTQDGAIRRLQQLVQWEDMQLLAGFGKPHEYRIRKEEEVL